MAPQVRFPPCHLPARLHPPTRVHIRAPTYPPALTFHHPPTLREKSTSRPCARPLTLLPAVVLWTLFFGLYKGEGGNPLGFLNKLVLGGVAVGLAFGIIILFWMSRFSRRHDHNDVTLQA